MAPMLSRFGDDLEPELRQFVERVNAAYASYGQAATPSEARVIAERVREPWRRGGPTMAATTEADLPTRHGAVRVRVYRPQGETSGRTLVYMHGGGWTIFSIDTHDRLMREYAERADVNVVGVDYALSPEVKFPVALEQCVDVIGWLAEQGEVFGVSGDRIATGGDSAGGNLALAAALLLREAGRGDLLRGVLLNYASFGGDFSEEYHARFGGAGYMLSSAEVTDFVGNYLRDAADRADPLVRLVDADLRGVPPVFMAIPECDLLSCQSLEMVPRLRAAGVEVTDVVYKGASHSFLEAMSISPIANRALNDGAAWLKSRL